MPLATGASHSLPARKLPHLACMRSRTWEPTDHELRTCSYGFILKHAVRLQRLDSSQQCEDSRPAVDQPKTSRALTRENSVLQFDRLHKLLVSERLAHAPQVRATGKRVKEATPCNPKFCTHHNHNGRGDVSEKAPNLCFHARCKGGRDKYNPFLVAPNLPYPPD